MAEKMNQYPRNTNFKMKHHYIMIHLLINKIYKYSDKKFSQ